MSKNILIRDLSEDQQEKLERLRESFGEKTASKTVLYLIDKFEGLMEEVRRARIEKSNIQEKSNSLQEFYDTIKEEVNSFKKEQEEDYEEWD